MIIIKEFGKPDVKWIDPEISCKYYTLQSRDIAKTLTETKKKTAILKKYRLETGETLVLWRTTLSNRYRNPPSYRFPRPSFSIPASIRIKHLFASWEDDHVDKLESPALRSHLHESLGITWLHRDERIVNNERRRQTLTRIAGWCSPDELNIARNNAASLLCQN